MDLFVDAIDSKLQSSEKYLKLVRSRKRRKKTHGARVVTKNKADGGGSPAAAGQAQPEKASPAGQTQSARTEGEKDPQGAENATPFLNFLIDTCTDLVRASNQVTGPNYRNLLESGAGAAKIASIRRKCQKAIDEIKGTVRKIAPDHVFDDETNLLDVLCDEIEHGLKTHNRTRHARDAQAKEESPATAKTPSSVAGNSESSNDGSAADAKTSPFRSRKELRKELLKFERACLTTYSIEVDPRNYDLGKRPQDLWRDSIDNFSNRSYNRATLEKLNQIEPQVRFAEDFKEFRYFEKGFVPKIYPKFEFLSFADREHRAQPHPYAQEINSLEWSDDRNAGSHQGYKILGGHGNLFRVTEHKPLSNPRYKMVRTAAEFDEMMDKIKNCRLVSIDLEHHDADTYRGFTCLIQLSTVDLDFIVDPFNIFGHVRHLNRVTTDPKVIKIMHGASNDVIWLQRDFGVFVVNLFDTREAAKVLNLPEQSLAKLLDKYFKIKLNKIHQLADWSKRDMLAYACSDSHYLIPLYVTLKNEILSKSDGRVKMLQVMNASRGLCLKQHADKGIELYNKFKTICRRNKIHLSQLDFVSYNFLLNLIAFRNYAARKLDKSEQLIVRDYQISIIVKRLTIELIHRKFNDPELILIRPRSIQFILNCLNENNTEQVGRAHAQIKSDEIEKLLMDFSIVFHQFSLL